MNFLLIPYLLTYVLRQVLPNNAKVMGLIFAQFNIALPWDVAFHQLQHL